MKYPLGHRARIGLNYFVVIVLLNYLQNLLILIKYDDDTQKIMMGEIVGTILVYITTKNRSKWSATTLKRFLRLFNSRSRPRLVVERHQVVAIGVRYEMAPQSLSKACTICLPISERGTRKEERCCQDDYICQWRTTDIQFDALEGI